MKKDVKLFYEIFNTTNKQTHTKNTSDCDPNDKTEFLPWCQGYSQCDKSDRNELLFILK